MNAPPELNSYIMNKSVRYNRDNVPFSNYFLVGDTTDPCLSMSIQTEEYRNVFGKKFTETAHLMNIKNLRDCLYDEVPDEIYERGSFHGVLDTPRGATLSQIGSELRARELLDSVIEYTRTNYPYVKRFKLSDKSYIPCGDNDTNDLLTYSIALYGKTWYEMKYNAYMEPPGLFSIYRTEVTKYCSKETKSKITWDVFMNKYILLGLPFVIEKIGNNYAHYERMFNSSDTFPDFFVKLNKEVEKKDKCIFFKFWLEQFIASQIRIHREWFINLHQSRQIGGKRKTMKNRRVPIAK